MTMKNPLHWLLSNLLGICLYLMIQYYIVVPRPEGDELNGIDQIYIWMVFALPLLVIVFALDVVWLGAIIKQRSKDGNPQRLIEWLVVCVIWAIVIFTYGIALRVLEVFIMIGKSN
jgi:hypothetical protein